MKKNMLSMFFLTALLFLLCLSSPLAFATDPDTSIAPAPPTAAASNGPDTATIGGTTPSSQPVADDTVSLRKDPYISEVIVYGDFNRGAIGIDYFKNITISLVGENLTDDNFLTEAGLHWSDKTESVLIRGQELGNFDFSTFSSDIPNIAVKTFSNNIGDSGRLTFIGQTKSGIDLDLIWTVTGSDRDAWAQNSGYASAAVRGLAFCGEQFFSNAKGNAIAVLYNNASNLGIQYKIVRHGTDTEQPIIVSFIATDIDSAQGVETDLANIVELIPEDSGLVKHDNIIYDRTAGVVNLNGSRDLPRGGYLGASFLSSFNYIFYSPAPERVSNSYLYPIAVRYDIFGSSLQAKLVARTQQHITISYLDTKGQTLKPDEHYKGFTDESYSFSSAKIDNYQLVDIEQDTTDINHPHLRFIYAPVYRYVVHFIDEAGNKLAEDRHYSLLEGKNFNFEAPQIPGFTTPESFSGVASKDTEHSFVYKKVLSPTPGTQTQPKRPSSPSPGSNQGGGSASRASIAPSGGTGTSPLNKQVEAPAQDPFCVNTGMTPEEKETFLRFLAEARAQAVEKYGNNMVEVNHAITNAVAYEVYHDNLLQSSVNDFGEEPSLSGYSNIAKKLKAIHDQDKYLIDFPHLATSLASTYPSSLGKEHTKFILGFSLESLQYGISFKDNFFQQNTKVGDELTVNSTKDRNTDIDAYIFHYHPEFKNLTFDEQVIKLYSMENLTTERERLYKEALEAQSGSIRSAEEQEKLNTRFAKITIGGFGLAALGWWGRNQKKILSWIANFKDTLVSNIVETFDAARKKIIDSVAKFGLALLSVVATGKQLAKNICAHIIEPARKGFSNVVIKPITSFVDNAIVKPVVRNVIKPVTSFVNTNIVQPLVSNVIQPIYNKVTAKTTKTLGRKPIKIKAFNTWAQKQVKELLKQPFGKLIKKPKGKFFKKHKP